LHEILVVDPDEIVGYSRGMKKVTARQKELLKVVYDYIKTTGYPPTIKEMRDSLKVTSNQSVIDLLEHLENKKLIKRQEGVARSIVILPFGYEAIAKTALAPFLGMSHAGSPIDAIQIDGEWQELSNEAAQLKDNVFLLKVLGDSMINAGIDNGDVVLVRVQKEFVSGDIVLAEVEGESTIKRFMSDDTPPFIYLKPENPKHKVIPFNERTKLKGKIISILKEGSWKSIN